ncbi:Down syndrome cell adhesion molecule-like protein Dscam2 [Halotydeus destructor]|nr:Down syndrome cell adhesion molecule-like protein Dscam2 [Halotydeus destructor]
MFTEVFDEIITQPDRFVSLKCTAVGNPLPRIIWALDGQPLIDSDTSDVLESSVQVDPNLSIRTFRLTDANGLPLVTSSLNISRLGEQDGGLYSCSAVNVQGITYHRRRLNVLGKPTVRPMADVKVISGQGVTLNCPVSGYPIDSITWYKVAPAIEPFSFAKGIRQGQRTRLVCSITQGDAPFEFLWLKDGRRLDPAPMSIGVRSDDFSSDLTFSRVTSRHNGNYTCTVRNDVATVEHSTTLLVDVPPYWKFEPKDSSAVGGQNVLIDCLADGVPSPSITWERAAINAPRFYAPISSGPQFEVYANGSLLIKNVQEDDGAYYLCQASNSIGPGLSKVLTLTVHVPPKFVLKFQSEAVRLHAEAILKCEAQGDQPLGIKWTMDKQAISGQDEVRFVRTEEHGDRRLRSTLRISSVTRRDSALFTCTVSNAYGSDEMNIRLMVQEAPESPLQLKLVDRTSRTAKLSWLTPFSGNSVIIKYWITCHPRDTFRPEGAPLDIRAEVAASRSATIMWKAPEPSTWNGLLKGYYIGYKVRSSSDQYLYKTLEVRSGSGSSGPLEGHEKQQQQQLSNLAEPLEHSVILSGLRPATEYVVVVQAYNSMGTGPRSDEQFFRTDEDVPSLAPTFVHCTFIGSESLTLNWEPPPVDSVNGQLQGYKVVYRPIGGDASETRERVTPPVTEVKLNNLHKYTNYSVQVLPFNRKGTGSPSRPVYCRTDEDVPGSPSELKLVISSPDSVIATWRDPDPKNGYITKYTIYWKELNKNRTKSAVTLPKSRSNLFASRYRIPDPLPQYKLTGLSDQVTYEIWVTAFTRIGEGPPTPILPIVTTKYIPARILQLDETIALDSISASDLQVIPMALGCHSVGSEPVTKTWSRNGKDFLVPEADGSLVVNSLEEPWINFTCSVTNVLGSDHVTYHVVKGYELYYRVSRSEGQEWQVKPLAALSNAFASSRMNIQVTPLEPTSTLSNVRTPWTGSKADQDGMHLNQTVHLENLICGASYQAYITELETGSRTETISFRTQGSAPMAPRKEDVLRLFNDTSILIYPISWEAGSSCPITKLTIEYRMTGSYAWRLLSSRPISSDVTEISDILPRTIYSIRMTAHSAGPPATMAEYEMRVGLADEDIIFGSGLQRAFLVDTTTLISLVSSCIVLLIGSIAVVCLVIYKRKSQRKMASASSSVSVNSRSGHYGHNRRQSVPASSQHGGSQSTGLTVHSEEAGISSGRAPVRNDSRDKLLSTSVQSSSAMTSNKMATTNVEVNRKNSSVNNNGRSARSSSITTKGGPSPFRGGKLPAVPLPTKRPAVSQPLEEDIYHDYDEITPYATFTLSKDDDRNVDEEFKTFTVKIGEPAYHFKGAMEGVPSSSRDYLTSGRGVELSSIQPKNREPEMTHYHCSNVAHSDRSSNCTELLRAYEYGRHFPTSHQVQEHFYEEGEEYGITGAGNTDASVTSEDAETPTDPGIRMFTKSPPRPNEQRVATCFGPNKSKLKVGQTAQPTVVPVGRPVADDHSDDPQETTSSSSSSEEEDEPSSSIATTPTNEGVTNFGAIPRDRSRKPTWSNQETVPLRGRGFSSSSKKQLVEADVNLIVPKDEIVSSDEGELKDDLKLRQRRSKRPKSPASISAVVTSGHVRKQSPPSCQPSKRPPVRRKSTADEIEC